MQPHPSGVGEALRTAREARGLSRAEIARRTKIREAYLAALEDEHLEALPALPYARGYLRAYATVLELDPDAVVAAFERRFPARRAALRGAVDLPLEPGAPPSRMRRLLTYGIWALALLAIFLAYVGYTQVREFAKPLPAAPSSTPSAESTAGTQAPGAIQPTPGPTTDSGAPAVSVPGPEAGVTLVLVATGRSWLRVRLDGARAFEGYVDDGDTRTWTAERELFIRIGNAGVVDLTVNGRPLGIPGRAGEVVNRTFTAPPAEP